MMPSGSYELPRSDVAGRVSAWTNVLGTFTPSYVNAAYGTGRPSGVALPNGVNTSYQWEDNTGDFRLKEIKHLAIGPVADGVNAKLILECQGQLGRLFQSELAFGCGPPRIHGPLSQFGVAGAALAFEAGAGLNPIVQTRSPRRAI